MTLRENKNSQKQKYQFLLKSRSLKHRVKPGAKPPKAVIFPDGTKQRLESWRSLLVNIARWAVTHISKGKIPIKAGSSRFLLHTENRHPHGREFFNPERAGDLWLETHFNSPRCVSLACRFLSFRRALLILGPFYRWPLFARNQGYRRQTGLKVGESYILDRCL